MSSGVHAFAVELNSDSNVRDDDDDDDKSCDYGDEHEHDDHDEGHAKTMFSVELPSDSSSSLIPREREKKRIREGARNNLPSNGRVGKGNGDTGSSTSNIILPTVSFTVPETPGKPSNQLELDTLIDSLKKQLIDQQKIEVEKTKADIAKEAYQQVVRIEAQEAWTAQQKVQYVETAAHAVVTSNERKLREVEMRAEMVINESASATSQEQDRTLFIIEEARSSIAQRDAHSVNQSSEMDKLRAELHHSQLRTEETRKMAMIAFEQAKQENISDRMRMEKLYEEARAKDRIEMQKREKEMEDRMKAMLDESNRRASIHLASNSTELQVRDLAFLVSKCVNELGRMSSKLETTVDKKPEVFSLSSPREETTAFNKASLTTRPASTRATLTSQASLSKPDRNAKTESLLRGKDDRSRGSKDPDGGGDPPDDDEPSDHDDEKDHDKRTPKDKKKKKKPSPSGDGDPDDSPNSDSSENDDDRERKTKYQVKTKEADSVKLLPLPEKAGQFRKWRLSTRRKVIAASADPTRAYKWIKKVEDKDTTFEELRNSGPFLTLDSKLGSCLSEIAKGELGRRITLMTEREDKEGRNVTGRQLLKLVYDYYKTDESAGIIYDLSDLLRVNIRGDQGWKSLLDFRDTWDETLAGVENEPSDDILEPIFKDRVRECKCIAHDYENYIRAPKGSDIKSYLFLYDAVDSFLTRKLKEQNRSQIRNDSKDGKRNDNSEKRGRPKERNATPAPKAGGKGRGNKRGGSKGKPKKGDQSPRSSVSPSRRINGKQKSSCYTWKNTGRCEKHEKGECNFEHKEEEKGSGGSRSPGSSQGGKRGRDGSKGRKGKGKGGKKGGGSGSRSESASRDKKDVACYFFLRCKCMKGKDCDFKHCDKELAAFKKKGADFR